MTEKFHVVVDEWKVFYEGKVKASTFSMYVQIAKKITDKFGDHETAKLTPLLLQQYLNELHRVHYAKSTIQKHKITMNLIFKYYRMKYPQFINPCAELYLPKGAVVKKRIPVELESAQVVFENKYKQNYLYPLFLLSFGLRRSEALALHWEDLDLEGKMLSVNKTIEFINNKPRVWNVLKNGDKERKIPIPPIVFHALAEHKRLHKKGIIFVNSENDYLKKNQITMLWRDFKKRSGLDVTQHQFRHTYATLLYRSGVDLKTAMELLGHRSLKMLIEIYAHTDDSTLRNAVCQADQYISNQLSITAI